MNQNNMIHEHLTEFIIQKSSNFSLECLILFGSRSLGLANSDSDWDLLLIGEGITPKINNFDLISIPLDKANSDIWLGSELAGHVAKFGITLMGNSTWLKKVFCSKKSVERKRFVIQARLDGLLRVWDILSEEHRKKHSLFLRRQLQRLMILNQEDAVPPAACLDILWDNSNKSKEISNFQKLLNQNPRYFKFWDLLIEEK